MTSSVHRSEPAGQPTATFPAGAAHITWLPRVGLGNGVDTDDAWVPVLEVTGPVAVRLLDTLARADVPAFAAPIRPGPDDVWRLWVGTRHYFTAEQVLLRTMPAILADNPDGLR